MRFARLVLSFLFILSSSPRLSSQQSTAVPRRDPQAIALLSRCTATMGTFGRADTLLATGRLSYADGKSEPETIVIMSIGPDRVRREATKSSGRQVSIMNGMRGRINHGGLVDRLPYWQLKYARPEYIPAALCSYDLTRPLMSVVYVGLETVGHIQLFVPVQNQEKNLGRFEPLISDFHLYLDAQTFTVVKTKTLAFSPNAIENHSDWETYYTEYRAVDRVLMPFRISNLLGGQKLWDIVFTSVQTNVPLAASNFE